MLKLTPLRRRLRTFIKNAQDYLRPLYERLKIEELIFFILFLLHRYSPEQFNPLFVKYNMRLLFRVAGNDGLSANRNGKLHILQTRWQKVFFLVKNFLLMGALQKRVEQVILYTCITVTLELNNPFTRKVLNFFLVKKLSLLRRFVSSLHTINGKDWDTTSLKAHIECFERNSLIQNEVIRAMHKAFRRQKLSGVVTEANAALKKGLYPLLVREGLSGSYWMRGTNRQIIGLFKPFDEELHAPNNPVGPRYRGALGLRKSRVGCRVGEAAHHEVAAFLVDEFFGFGIVPRTYYASFTHHMFFSAKENRMAVWRLSKTKLGSFQEFIAGFETAGKLSYEDRQQIALDEFQLLVVLDVIIGNTDRNINNILIGDNKIAAIDHGLSFPDRHHQLSYWYWSYFSQGQEPLYHTLKELMNNFPFDMLSKKLRGKCFISLNALDRMRERIALFSAAINDGLVPGQLELLFKTVFLNPLLERKETLGKAAQEQVRLFKEGCL